MSGLFLLPRNEIWELIRGSFLPWAYFCRAERKGRLCSCERATACAFPHLPPLPSSSPLHHLSHRKSRDREIERSARPRCDYNFQRKTRIRARHQPFGIFLSRRRCHVWWTMIYLTCHDIKNIGAHSEVSFQARLLRLRHIELSLCCQYILNSINIFSSDQYLVSCPVLKVSKPAAFSPRLGHCITVQPTEGEAET